MAVGLRGSICGEERPQIVAQGEAEGCDGITPLVRERSAMWVQHSELSDSSTGEQDTLKMSTPTHRCGKARGSPVAVGKNIHT